MMFKNLANWAKRQQIKTLPTVATWEEMGFAVVEKPEDFFNIGFTSHSKKTHKFQGIICPIPSSAIPDKATLAGYYNFISEQRDFHERTKSFGDRVARLGFESHRTESQEGLPIAIEQMLCTAFETTFGKSEFIVYQINSNHHRTPAKHEPTAVASLDGATTILFTESADGKLTGKKSLPPNSIAVFVGMHAAPNTPDPRLNILCL